MKLKNIILPFTAACFLFQHVVTFLTGNPYQIM